MTDEDSHNAAFRRHHMGGLLHRMGALLPKWLAGPDMVRECRELEQLCWSEVGYLQQPVFDGDLPPFLMVDSGGSTIDLSHPMPPAELAGRMAALTPSPLPASSFVGTNLCTLARLLNLAPFESRWLLWSYCIRRYGSAILPIISLRDKEHGCEVLALLCDMPVDVVQFAVAAGRLHTWSFLDGIGGDGEIPSLLSGWLSATDQFADWIEQPYATDSDLLTALCQAQFSLTASR
jgi:hypothetical protein